MEKWKLKKRITQIFRASLGSTCNLSSRSVSNSVQEPTFVSSPRHDFQKLDHSLSLTDNHQRRQHLLLSERVSLDCGRCRRLGDSKKIKKERRVSEIGVFYEAGGEKEGKTCPPSSPASPSSHWFSKERKAVAGVQKKGRKTTKLLSNSYGFTSSSSDDSDGDDLLFSSDEEGGRRGREAETETLFSSKSFSSDSSGYYYSSSNANKKKKKTSRRRRPRGGDGGSKHYYDWDDGFKPLVSIPSSSTKEKKVLTEKEKVGDEGFPLEKQSDDPYSDFRSSMLEMILEKQMFGKEELEHLLHSYLRLNSPHHHPIILQVFDDIWEVLFGN